MANGMRGEVEVELGGVRRTLCLTLGALAAMETGLGVGGFGALAERLKRLSAGDLVVVLGALLPGEDVGALEPREAAGTVAAVFRGERGVSTARADARRAPPPFGLLPSRAGEEKSRSPWGDMLRAAVVMGLPPEAFWRLSLREWRMLTAVEAQPVMGRGEFERMLEAYGDGS